MEGIELKEREYHMGAYSRLPVEFVAGRGVRLTDRAGKSYLDLIAGLGVVSVGHCHPRLVEALNLQAGKLWHVSNLFYTEPQVLLAARLAERFEGGHCFFANSGAEANEGAVKLARKHFAVQDRQDRTEIITALDSFHGRTLAMAAATGQPERRQQFGPVPGGFRHVPLNDIDALEEAVDERTAAVLLEPIQGEGGVRPASHEYLRAARRICDERGALLIFDEVQTGIGRTGMFFAFEHAGVKPDIVTLAKGLGGGFPVATLMAKGPVSRAFEAGDHGSTFGGNPLAATAALGVLEILEEEGLIRKAAERGAYLKKRLLEAARNNAIKEVRGAGLMVGLELQEPVAQQLALAALSRGLVINAIGETVVRLLPPLVITESELDEGVVALSQALSDVSGGRAKESQ